MTISNKDKKLLVYLIAVGLVAVVYFFIAKPNMDKQQALQMEIESIKNQVNHYNDIYIHQEDYENQIAEAQVQYNESLNRFFGGLNQENTLMNIKGIEDATDTWISRISFQETQVVIGGEAAKTESEIPADESGESSGSTVDNSSSAGLSGLKQDLTLDYSCTYKDFKRFIEYIQNYDQRLFISSINASYSSASDQVAGTMVLSQYAVTGSGIEYNAPDLSGVSTGVDNIFSTLGDQIPELNDEIENQEETVAPQEGDESNESDNQSGEETDEDSSENNEDNSDTPNNKPKSGGII